ncbi:uncharacterized protein LOC124357624 [Homalodisca vitripennis]|uniref:uncharacterized protein LOC124357624 n=1 Tax=Homalodisca vitripennis TaxID=197043 RepID=UPI001EEC3D7D|nr:uncharacterized protein LOC124357624 [Homalodisca vitripennis]XP_046665533.1 uncharacterized protein LOC124357624 [Homalodisca vitripennis]XP_046665535.1 uncharacterized protein LOC124357624 [Homalodisca vitripennis]XP_046665536.1 uncharacterized protein LOC124357624 [Homalodisca vitripennis]
MVSFPVLSKGPFSIDLDKSVRYITYIFKGISCGIAVSTIFTILVLIVTSDTTSTSEVILSICVTAFAVAYFYLCVYLYKGVEERNRTWIFPWFLVTTVVAFALIILFFVTLFNGFGILQVVLPFVIVFLFYCNWIVYSLYIDLGTNFVQETPPTQVVPS